MKRLTVVAGLLMAVSLSASAQNADNEQMQKWMKAIGGSMKESKQALDGKDAAALAATAEKVQKAFKESADFWKKHKTDDAAKLSTDAANAAAATAAAAKAGDLDKAKAAWGGVGKTCKACHEAHREDLGDHKYAIKF
ncbi:MAG TPA: cytochrome c [Verrucomicrobiae bacterium]|nr:cytochrome c [Verrucomicrobiae bacterium]